MKSLDEVLKAYNIHSSADWRCDECPYYNDACIAQLEKDLYKYVMLLREENKKLMIQLYRSQQYK